VNSPIRGRAFFQNVGTTLRQGVDLNLLLKTDRLLAWFAYSYIDATFRSGFIASSTNNPGADANGNIQVQPGNHLPGIPSNLWKMGVDYNVTDAWTVGGTGTAVSGQFLFGDEANLTAKTPAYFVLILHTSYQLTTHCGPSTVPGAPRGGDVSAESGTASLPAHQKSRSPLRDDDRK
jgi:iron complex outermembrane receptor protein